MLSDMAPNFSGDLDSDHIDITGLTDLAIKICDKHLRMGGFLLMKTLHGRLE